MSTDITALLAEGQRLYTEGDLLRWSWKPDRYPTFTNDIYWCKSRTVIVLADGRWVDTFWHSLNDTKNIWNNETQIRPEDVDATFLVNVKDLAPLDGPRDQYAEEDTFHLCNGGGGSWRDYMRKGATPKPDRVREVLQRRLWKSRSPMNGMHSANRCVLRSCWPTSMLERMCGCDD